MQVASVYQQISLFQGLTPDTLQPLQDHSRIWDVKKETCLFTEQEQVSSLYILVDGVAFLYKDTRQWERRIIFICYTYEVLHVQIVQGQPVFVSCRMLTDGQVLLIPLSIFRQAMARDPVLQQRVMAMMTQRLGRLYRQLKNSGHTLHLIGQIAVKLWKFAHDYGQTTPEGTMIPFEISISFLAECVGSRRESVSRVIKKLIDKNYIIVKNKRFYLVKNKNISDLLG